MCIVQHHQLPRAWNSIQFLRGRRRMCHIRCIHRPKKGKSNEGSPKIEGWKCCKNRSATARGVEILNKVIPELTNPCNMGKQKRRRMTWEMGWLFHSQKLQNWRGMTRYVPDSKFWNPAGIGCGRISPGVSGRNRKRKRIVWWLLYCSACWRCAWSCVMASSPRRHRQHKTVLSCLVGGVNWVRDSRRQFPIYWRLNRFVLSVVWTHLRTSLDPVS